MTDARAIPYGRQWIDEDDIAAVVRCLRDPNLTQGPRIAEFEAGLAAATGARFATVVSSGTAALHLAALAATVGPGDVVITSPISFAATANAMAYCGARVAFCDVDPRTGLMDIGSLAELAAKLARSGHPPKAIVPVDFAGQAVDRARVREIAERFGARVIEDCAHSLGARYTVDGVEHAAASCSHAEFAILSFHPVKHITTGEGGAVLTNDPARAQTARDLRSHGIIRDPARLERPQSDPMRGGWYQEQQSLGYNYRLTDMQCALGSSQLRKLPRFLERRRALSARYDLALSEGGMRERIEPLSCEHPDRHARHLYVVQVRRQRDEPLASVAQRRRSLYEALAARGIQTQVHYVPIPEHPFWRGASRAPSGPWPGAEAFYAASLSLPLFPAMSDDDADRVMAALRTSMEDSCGA
jgi:UDP-4-amino-4,6-dideoxy-N-acetyl-beta-L-altrosamine transaminase